MFLKNLRTSRIFAQNVCLVKIEILVENRNCSGLLSLSRIQLFIAIEMLVKIWCINPSISSIISVRKGFRFNKKINLGFLQVADFVIERPLIHVTVYIFVARFLSDKFFKPIFFVRRAS